MKAFYIYFLLISCLGISCFNGYSQEETPFRANRINPESKINCLSNPELIGVEIEDWIPGINYLWSNGSTDSVIQVHPLSSTNYSLTISHTNYSGSIVKLFEVLVENDPIIAENDFIFISNAVCPGTELSLNMHAEGGHGLLRYEWETGEFSKSITVAPLSNSTYQVTITDECGTISKAAVEVEVEPQHQLIVPANSTIDFVCLNKEIEIVPNWSEISGGIGFGYLMSIEGSNFSTESINVMPYHDKIITAQITDDCKQQFKTIAFELKKINPVIPDIEEISICSGVELELTNANGVEFYYWNDGQMHRDYSKSFEKSEIIDLIYYDECGDHHSITRSILVETINTQFEYETSIGSNMVHLQASDPTLNSFSWILNGNEVGNQSSLEISIENGSADLTLKSSNKNGCSDSQTRTIVLRDGFEAPTAFSPNGDGLNDKFSISFQEELLQFNIEIFNRWGQLIYESNDQYFGWNGESDNESDQFSSFAYRIKGISKSGNAFSKNGTISLVRTK